MTAMAFNDLAAQRKRLGSSVERAIQRVLEHGRFIMGPEVEELEIELAARVGVRHAVTCASGTDALVLSLRAGGIGVGDLVAVPAFTFAATAGAVVLAGAVPVFVDVDPRTKNIDPCATADLLRTGIDGQPVRGVIAVDLFGTPADYDALAPAAERAGAVLIADAAQSFGASVEGRAVGSLAPITTTSFFPSKPLGCYGDGGAILTDDDDIADILRSLRVHGQGDDKYDNIRIGTNSRLDTVQAAVLLQKLTILDDELAARRRIAARYGELLEGFVVVPECDEDVESAWAQYTVRLGGRDRVAEELSAAGIPSAVYYRRPLHRQPAFRSFPVVPGGAPVADTLAEQVLSLPFHPYLSVEDLETVVGVIEAAT